MNKIWLYFLFLVLLINSDLNGAEWKSVKEQLYAVTLREKIHDADTYVFDIFVMDLSLALVNQKCREQTFDSCEVNRIRKTVTITNEELIRGRQAQIFVQDLFNRYQIFITTKSKLDAYGRRLVTVYLSDIDHPGKYIALRDFIIEQKFDRSQL